MEIQKPQPPTGTVQELAGRTALLITEGMSTHVSIVGRSKLRLEALRALAAMEDRALADVERVRSRYPLTMFGALVIGFVLGLLWGKSL